MISSGVAIRSPDDVRPEEWNVRIHSARTMNNIYSVSPSRADMGDSACYRDYCPECDLQVTIIDEECPECGTHLPQDEN